MQVLNILKQLDWTEIFENSSQYENLYDFLCGEINLKRFVRRFYPRSQNRRIIKGLSKNDIDIFKKHGKKLWNLSNTRSFSYRNERQKRKMYLMKL